MRLLNGSYLRCYAHTALLVTSIAFGLTNINLCNAVFTPTDNWQLKIALETCLGNCTEWVNPGLESAYCKYSNTSSSWSTGTGHCPTLENFTVPHGQGSGNYGHISNWNTSKLHSLRNVFRNAENFNADVSKWSVGSITNMQSAFHSAAAFNVDLSTHWNVGRVYNFSYMYMNATSFNFSLCGESWIRPKNASAMIDMFKNAGSGAQLSLEVCCPSGEYVHNVSEYECRQCDAGSYQGESATKVLSCSICQKAKFQDELGQTKCKSCPTGKSAKTVPLENMPVGHSLRQTACSARQGGFPNSTQLSASNAKKVKYPRVVRLHVIHAPWDIILNFMS